MTDYKTLDAAIDLGEYYPEVLEQFEEFRRLSKYSKFQLIRKALKNREKQLRKHYSEVVNQLDFSKKPHLKGALDNIMSQLHQLNLDEEQLLVDYS